MDDARWWCDSEVADDLDVVRGFTMGDAMQAPSMRLSSAWLSFGLSLLIALTTVCVTWGKLSAQAEGTKSDISEIKDKTDKHDNRIGALEQDRAAILQALKDISSDVKDLKRMSEGSGRK